VAALPAQYIGLSSLVPCLDSAASRSPKWQRPNIWTLRELERYAAMHSQAYGEPVDALTLIPHMLEAFMARDRGFKKVSNSRGTE
jgi:hypothetical protein